MEFQSLFQFSHSITLLIMRISIVGPGQFAREKRRKRWSSSGRKGLKREDREEKTVKFCAKSAIWRAQSNALLPAMIVTPRWPKIIWMKEPLNNEEGERAHAGKMRYENFFRAANPSRSIRGSILVYLSKCKFYGGY